MGTAIDNFVGERVTLREIESFYKENYDFLVAFGVKLSGNREDAEDIVADVCTNLLEKYTQKDIRKLKSYIFYSIYKTHLKKKRGLYERKTTPFSDMSNLSVNPLNKSPLELVADQEERDLLMKGVEKMTPGQSQVFHYRIYEDMSIEDTARATGQTENAVKLKFRRSLHNLRKHLKSNGVDWNGRGLWIHGEKRLEALAQ